jgi:hypothetical protein
LHTGTAALMLSEYLAVTVASVNLAVTIFGGFIFLMTIKSRQAVQDVLLKRLSDDVEALSRTVEALRRGDGWIQGPPHKHVDREYD